MNQRPSGYEPDELPGCSTPRSRGSEKVSDELAAVNLRLSEPFPRRRPDLARLSTPYKIGIHHEGHEDHEERRACDAVRHFVSFVRFVVKIKMGPPLTPRSERGGKIWNSARVAADFLARRRASKNPGQAAIIVCIKGKEALTIPIRNRLRR